MNDLFGFKLRTWAVGVAVVHIAISAVAAIGALTIVIISETSKKPFEPYNLYVGLLTEHALALVFHIILLFGIIMERNIMIYAWIGFKGVVLSVQLVILLFYILFASIPIYGLLLELLWVGFTLACIWICGSYLGTWKDVKKSLVVTEAPPPPYPAGEAGGIQNLHFQPHRETDV